MKRRWFGRPFHVVVICVIGVALLAGCSDWFGGDGDWDNDELPELRPPYDLTVTLGSDDSVLLEWKMDNTQEFDGFIADRRTDDTDHEEVGNIGAGSNNFTDYSELSPATTYYYRVGAYRHDQEPCWCDEVSIEIPGVDPEPLAPPAWIQGTWSDGTNTWSFSGDNVVFNGPDGDVDFKVENQNLADLGATDSYYYDETPSTGVYTLTSHMSGFDITTYRFVDSGSGTLNYYLDSLFVSTLNLQ
jgi:hypothetical protein